MNQIDDNGDSRTRTSQEKQVTITKENENIWKIVKDGAGGRRKGRQSADEITSFRACTLTYVHTYALSGLGNASAHWSVLCACPGLPAVVVSENFGNKLTRGSRERTRVRGDLAAPVAVVVRRRQDSFTSCITIMNWSLLVATTVTHHCRYRVRIRGAVIVQRSILSKYFSSTNKIPELSFDNFWIDRKVADNSRKNK